MAGVETTITSVLDIIPFLKAKNWRKYLTVFVICIIYFLTGLTFTFRSGTFWIGKIRCFFIPFFFKSLSLGMFLKSFFFQFNCRSN